MNAFERLKKLRFLPQAWRKETPPPEPTEIKITAAELTRRFGHIIEPQIVATDSPQPNPISVGIESVIQWLSGSQYPEYEQCDALILKLYDFKACIPDQIANPDQEITFPIPLLQEIFQSMYVVDAVVTHVHRTEGELSYSNGELTQDGGLISFWQDHKDVMGETWDYGLSHQAKNKTFEQVHEKLEKFSQAMRSFLSDYGVKFPAYRRENLAQLAVSADDGSHSTYS